MATQTKPTAHDNPNALSTAERIRLILAENPNQTLEQVAEQVRVSRERVRQIQARHGLKRQTPKMATQYCAGCGTPWVSARGERLNKRAMCRRCLMAQRREEVLCDYCGTPLIRMKNRRTKMAFCNRKHLGKWLGTTHGWGARQKQS